VEVIEGAVSTFAPVGATIQYKVRFLGGWPPMRNERLGIDSLRLPVKLSPPRPPSPPKQTFKYACRFCGAGKLQPASKCPCYGGSSLAAADKYRAAARAAAAEEEDWDDDEEEAVPNRYEALGQCERHPLCVRGFKHLGKGGKCRIVPLEDRVEGSEQPEPRPVATSGPHYTCRNCGQPKKAAASICRSPYCTNTCEKDPRCTRGYKHGGLGGLCRIPKPEDDAVDVETAEQVRAPQDGKPAAVGQCERNPYCVRGFKHGGKGGKCNIQPPNKRPRLLCPEPLPAEDESDETERGGGSDTESSSSLSGGSNAPAETDAAEALKAVAMAALAQEEAEAEAEVREGQAGGNAAAVAAAAEAVEAATAISRAAQVEIEAAAAAAASAEAARAREEVVAVAGGGTAVVSAGRPPQTGGEGETATAAIAAAAKAVEEAASIAAALGVLAKPGDEAASPSVAPSLARPKGADSDCVASEVAVDVTGDQQAITDEGRTVTEAVDEMEWEGATNESALEDVAAEPDAVEMGEKAAGDLAENEAAADETQLEAAALEPTEAVCASNLATERDLEVEGELEKGGCVAVTEAAPKAELGELEDQAVVESAASFAAAAAVEPASKLGALSAELQVEAGVDEPAGSAGTSSDASVTASGDEAVSSSDLAMLLPGSDEIALAPMAVDQSPSDAEEQEGEHVMTEDGPPSKRARIPPTRLSQDGNWATTAPSRWTSTA